MSTKELQNRLRDLGKSDRGGRPVLVQRYEKYGPQSEPAGDDTSGGPDAGRSVAHASEHPMMVMVDEATGNKYMRTVDHKGLGGEGDSSRLVKNMHQQLKCWGHLGGAGNALILKSDGEPAIVAVREALSRCHGGRIIPEQPQLGSIKPTAQQKRLAAPFATMQGSSISTSRTHCGGISR